MEHTTTDDGDDVLAVHLPARAGLAGTVAALDDAVRTVRRSPARALVITGPFRGGGVSKPDAGDPAEAERRARRAGAWQRDVLAPLVRGIRELPHPVIVGLSGATSGAGLALALAADVRVASSGTTISAGMDPEEAFAGGLPWLLHRMVGRPAAVRVLLAEDVGASEALRLGLLDEVVPAAELDGRCRAVARRLADLPSWFSTGVSRALRAAEELGFDDAARFSSYLVEDGIAQGAAAAGEGRR